MLVTHSAPTVLIVPLAQAECRGGRESPLHWQCSARNAFVYQNEIVDL